MKDLFCIIISSLSIFPLMSCGQARQDEIKKAEAALLEHPRDLRYYEQLTFIVSQHYLQLTHEQRMDIRKFLKEHARFSAITIEPPGEPGKLITISGTVRNEQGSPLSNVTILLFHTDAHGYYAPDDSIKKSMNEPDARLFGFVTTDVNGHYSFQTVEPGNYPHAYQGRIIPRHIHFEIEYPGFKHYGVQMAFEDDPSMQDNYWKDWTKNLHYPVVTLKKAGDQLNGLNDIVLVK